MKLGDGLRTNKTKRRSVRWWLVGLVTGVFILTIVLIAKNSSSSISSSKTPFGFGDSRMSDLDNSEEITTVPSTDSGKKGGWGAGLLPPILRPAESYVIMKDLGNATLRAELGRSTWHLLHTTAGRFPIKPTADEQKAMKDYLFLLSRLYPCGGCAKHFQQLLKDFPPVVTGREELKKWMCEAHNIVNERLKKPQFDCSKVDDRWDCGCGPELPV